MYARMINLTFDETVTHDQAHALYQDLVAEFRAIDGFRGCAFMLMPSARRGVTITYWDDAERASRGGERALPMMIERMKGLLAEPPEIVGYEVVDQFMIDPHQHDG